MSYANGPVALSQNFSVICVVSIFAFKLCLFDPSSVVQSTGGGWVGWGGDRTMLGHKLVHEKTIDRGEELICGAFIDVNRV